MSAASTDLPKKVVPAQLGFFAIYNPSLGTTDESFQDQILFYSSHESRERSNTRQAGPPDPIGLREEINEQLRQIGLAQGMVEFGRSFSDGASVDTVETEKCRIVLHEIEAGWWVIASIDLTVLPPATARGANSKDSTTDTGSPEYSSRELKPAILLRADILRAHATFLLHHASSMSALFVRTKRSKFMALLGRYWDMFLSTWTVLMHGNPATTLYGGIKLAASGELGIGVGEEERGSGEREVLEGFVGRIDGLVDVIVSKFGEEHTKEKQGTGKAQPVSPWLGSGLEPASADGVVFAGTGALSRKSVRDVSHWIEDLYRWGPYAYGVMDNPSSNRRRKKTRPAPRQRASASPSSEPPASTEPALNASPSSKISGHESDQQASSARIPTVTEDPLPSQSNGIRKRPSFRRGRSFNSTESESSHKASSKFVQYLKFGYGTHWTLGHNSNASRKPTVASSKHDISTPKLDASSVLEDDSKAMPNVKSDNEAHYLVGFLGNLEEPKPSTELIAGHGHDGGDNQDEDEETHRVLLRTLTVELERLQDARAEAEISIDLGSRNSNTQTSIMASSERTATSATSYESQDRNKTKKLRVVVYVKKPFIFVMLFELRTEVLAMASLYRSLHHQLSPLHKPLLASTTFQPMKPEVQSKDDPTPIYDLIWDPKALTVISNIPNIPDPYHVHYSESIGAPWSRLEALNTHMHIVLTYIAVTSSSIELERTCKTGRGWWIVWTRVPDTDPPTTPALSLRAARKPGVITNDGSDVSSAPQGRLTPLDGSTAGTSVSGPAHPFSEPKPQVQAVLDKEIFLVRRASDHVATKSSGRFGSANSAADIWSASPGKLVQGIGVDTKWYIDTLLNLNK